MRVLRARWTGLWVGSAAAGTLAATGLAVALLLGEPLLDAVLFFLTMLGTGAVSLLAASLLPRVARGSGRLRIGVKLLVPVILAVVVVLANIAVSASLMFISEQDMLLLAPLLGFAGVLAVVGAVPLTASITSGIQGLTEAVQRMAAGESAVRVRVETADEVGTLARAFNHMAQQVEEAARLRREVDEARRALLAAVSHDLRTPLSAIRAMLEAIEDGVVADPETVTRYHRAMHGEVERLSVLIDDLFELTQIEAGALRLSVRPTDVNELLLETAEAVQAEADRARVHLAVDVAPEVPLLAGDPQQLQRVLLNLLANAFRHTPPDGSVMLRAEPRASGVAVTVADNGEGIAAEDLPHVFERFYRGDKSRSRAGGGAGLGLAIARGIVEAHGGSIRVTSGAGHGTTFSILLPCAS